ncbi:hypothetical protein SKAU_G00217670 [Synaphobranchus kaupii]|uniref:Protein TOPAZ1 n=1 Tax=Synaphobranchus kaupii TaxID=118154 RepID=A0A9Q1FAD0_SYNKA|nr:hypothetical protein SKAU_G00217670 [Synaphobranchus kaupii]
MNTTPQKRLDGSSQAWAVTKRRQTASTAKKEKAEDRCLGVWQQTKEGCHNGKIAQVRSSQHEVGTAKEDAKSSHCMALRRRKSGGVTENWIYKVPAKKPNTEGSAAFHPNLQQILRDHTESSGLVNGSSVSGQIVLVSRHSGKSAEAVELLHDPNSCSPAAGHHSEVENEQSTCREEKVEPQVCESDPLCRQKLQQSKASPTRSNSSVNQAENPISPNLPAPCCLLSGTTKSPHFNSTWERYTTPSGLAQVERLHCVSQAHLEVSTALVQGSSGDEASSMSSDDDLMDEVLAPSGEIMCEIQDTGLSCQRFAPEEEEGPSGQAIDLLKAYEQDAIVLDVIQDDPELFGNVPEERKVVAVMKSETPLVSKVIRPVKNNHKITWDDAKLSATGNDYHGQQDPKKGVCRSIAPVGIDGNRQDLYSNGVRPILNGLARGFHIKSCLPPQTGTTDSTQSSVCEWLWADFEISVQGNARLNSVKASTSTSDEAWDAGLDADPMQTNVIPDLSAQSAAWAAGTFIDLSKNSEKYCRYYFSDEHTCLRNMCWYLHQPLEGDERFCMTAVQKLCSGESSHLHRAAEVFTGYYQKCPPGVHFDAHTLKSLLSTLFSRGIVKDLLSVLRVMTPYKILPPVEFILSVFERVSMWGLRIAVPDLLDLTAKSVKAGLVFATENFEYMQHHLELLQAPSCQMEVFQKLKYRVLETSVAWTPEAGDLAIALAEVECCKEQQDWIKLGSMFCSLCACNPSLAELNHLSGSIAMALLVDTPPTSPLPFSQFVKAVCQGASIGGLVKSLLGRIGVSLMLRYYKAQHWTKGKKLLDALNTLKVNYSTLKGLFAGESRVSRCRIISMSAEVFLGCGSMESAFSVLKDNEWILSSPLWQCEEADVVHRHCVLCRLAECTTQKNMLVETLEVLTKLADMQDVKVDASQYNVFHRHLKACLEQQNLPVASNIVELMFTKKIEVDVCLLRLLIHKLGKQSSWQKARFLYKSAVSVGCYPQTQMNKYCRILPVPPTLSEIEMTLALEMFMVSNASDIQNPGFFPHALQIVVKGKTLEHLFDFLCKSAALCISSSSQNEKFNTCGCSHLKVYAMSVITFLRWTMRPSSKPVAVQILQKRALSGAEAITALRPFYFAVHPDFFGQHPREREVNENSLKRLNGYLENLQKPGVRSLKPTKLTFYVRETTERKDDILSSGFRSVSFTLNTKDVLSTVMDVLRSCSLSMEHMQGLKSSAEPNGPPPEAGGAFYRPIRWDKTYYAFTGYRDPEQELEQARRVEPSLSLWLRNNQTKATEKQQRSLPRREELKRLKAELCNKLGLKDVRWQRSWGVTHRCCQLQSLSRLSQQNPESLHNLRGHTLVFTDQSGMNASGHVMLGTMDVHHQWTKLFERLPSYRALLQQTEWLKERISLLLGGIQVIHIERRGPLLTLEEHYSSLNAFHKRLLPRRPALHPRSLQDLAMTLESDRSSTTLHELGHFIVPTACETRQLQTVLQSQAQEARRRIKQHEKLEMEERELVHSCGAELSISSLRKEVSVSSHQMMVCCRRLLEERPAQLQGLRLCVSHFYSVQQDGDLCIPWNCKG